MNVDPYESILNIGDTKTVLTVDSGELPPQKVISRVSNYDFSAVPPNMEERTKGSFSLVQDWIESPERRLRCEESLLKSGDTARVLGADVAKGPFDYETVSLDDGGIASIFRPKEAKGGSRDLSPTLVSKVEKSNTGSPVKYRIIKESGRRVSGKWRTAWGMISGSLLYLLGALLFTYIASVLIVAGLLSNVIGSTGQYIIGGGIMVLVTIVNPALVALRLYTP